MRPVHLLLRLSQLARQASVDHEAASHEEYYACN